MIDICIKEEDYYGFKDYKQDNIPIIFDGEIIGYGKAYYDSKNGELVFSGKCKQLECIHNNKIIDISIGGK